MIQQSGETAGEEMELQRSAQTATAHESSSLWIRGNHSPTFTRDVLDVTSIEPFPSRVSTAALTVC
jgi:hypothetical protein